MTRIAAGATAGPGVAGAVVRRPRPAASVEPSRRIAGVAALTASLVAAVALAAGAAGERALFVVPAGKRAYPRWLRGPFAHVGLGVDARQAALLIAVLFCSYLVMVACASALPDAVVAGGIVVLLGIFMLAPPLFSADVFGYIDYARLPVLHGLDPYTHGAAAAPADAVVPFVRWHDVPSPYGPVFTIAGYPLAQLSVATTFWMYKTAAALVGLACVAMVWRIAAGAGRDPRSAAAFLAFNPLFLAFGVAGAHNDQLLELLVLAAIAAHLRGHDRSAGAQIAVASLVKASAGLVLPFLVIGARHRRRAVEGVAFAAAAVAIVSLAILGVHAVGFVPQLFGQQQLVASYSVPNQVGVLLGYGGLTAGLRALCVLSFGLAFASLLWRTFRGADPIACAGWATLAGLVTSAWLVPWYAVWLLPLAAIAPSRALRVGALALSAFLVTTHVVPHL